MDDKPLNDLESRAETLRQRIAEDQKSLEEIETLKVLMMKFLPNLLDSSPMKRVDAGGMLSAVAHTVVRAKEETKRDRIVYAVREVLSDGIRHTTRELIDYLKMLYGIEIGGTDPVALLSSYLSREKTIFHSDLKAGGWALRSAPGEAKSGDVGASPDLFINGSGGHQERMVSAPKEGAELG